MQHGERLKLFLAAYDPQKTDALIAEEIGASREYVRATARRQGLSLARIRSWESIVTRLRRVEKTARDLVYGDPDCCCLPVADTPGLDDDVNTKWNALVDALERV